jgi:hypothetical protein
VLGVISIAGIFVTAGLAYMARPKMDKVLNERKETLDNIQNNEEMSEEQKVEATKEANIKAVKDGAMVMLPVIIAGGLSAGCGAIGIHEANLKITDLSSAALASEMAYEKLYNKTKDIVGEEKAEEIKKEVANDSLSELQARPDFMSGFLQARGGNVPFYDTLTGMPFLSDMGTIMEIANSCNLRITSGGEPYLTVNEWCAEMDLPEATIRKFVGFDSGTPLQPKILSQTDINGVPVNVLGWGHEPKIVTLM